MSDPIPRLNAALEGRYRIERKLGEGGMATVYLADDLKHERKVALKVLKPELAAVVGAERFLAEIKTTANLQHPSILPLHDSGEADGVLYYVMPYVAGESLRERLDREHQLPLRDAVRIATDLAGALDYAHRQGVIHRDIKPANILLQDGKPVVSDFGIALAVSAGGGGRLTETGLSLGTPHYMSPEQATGDLHVGPATDIYALGCVLYEMLVGEPPFTGSTPQAVLGRVIKGDVRPAKSERSSVPPNVDAAIRTALERIPADRFPRGSAFAEALTTPSFRSARSPEGQGGDLRRVRAAMGLVVVAALAGLAGWWLAAGSDPRGSPRRLHLPVLPDLKWTEPGGFRLLDDGTGLVYVSSDTADAAWRLATLRGSSLEASEPRIIPGTDSVESFDPAPDSRSVAVIEGGSLRIHSMESAVSRTVLPSGATCCVRWGGDGSIYFTGVGGDLSRVPEGGGEVEVLSVNEAPHLAHAWATPVDGRRVLFEKVGLFGNDSRIVLLDTESGDTQDLAEGRYPVFADGVVVFMNRGATEIRAAELRGTRLDVPVTILADPQGEESDGPSHDLSPTGDLVYATRYRDPRRVPVWVARDGREEPMSTSDDLAGPYEAVRLSPDGRRLALWSWPRQQIHVKDLPDGPLRLLTPDGTVNYRLSWTPGGEGILYSSDRLMEPGDLDPISGVQVFRAEADGSGEPVAMGIRSPSAILSPDSAYWIFRTANVGERRGNLMARSTEDGASAYPLVATDARESQPAFSRDGTWFAYSSDITGRREVYVRSFPDPEAFPRVPISIDGGHSPAWSIATDELFYVAEDGGMWAMRYSADPADGFSVRERTRLFDTGPYRISGIDVHPHVYDVASDERFVMLRSLDPEAEERMTLVLIENALDAIRRLR
jgi:serine/threonine protein kinase